MPRFTPEAQLRFDEYLDHARAALAGCTEVSPEDIEQDVRAHIAAEFPPGSGWVRLDQLEAVLVRLGRPDQWVTDEDRPAWRRSIDWVRTRPAAVGRRVRVATERLRHGPDDWRLAYITFGLLLVGIFLFPLLVVLLPASYLVGRAALSRARDAGQTLGGQKWLIYPPLLIVSVPLLLGLLLWPLGVGGAIADDVCRHNRDSIQAVLELPRGLCEFLTYVYCMGGALSVWWVILGGVFLVAKRLPAALFPPLISKPGHSFGAWLFAPGVVLFAVWASATARTVPVADILRDKPWLRESRADWDEVRRPPVGVGQSKQVSSPASAIPLDVIQSRVLEFGIAVRDKRVDDLVAMIELPFFKGSSGPLLGPREPPVIIELAELRSFLSGFVQQFERPDQVPMDVRQVSTHALNKVREGGGEVQDLRRVVTNADTVIAIGTQGRTTGFLVYRTVGGRQKIVAMGSPQLLRNVP
jgi:hypothetical protein